jgi:hypothetical protein
MPHQVHVWHPVASLTGCIFLARELASFFANIFLSASYYFISLEAVTVVAFGHLSHVVSSWLDPVLHASPWLPLMQQRVQPHCLERCPSLEG